MPHFSWHHYFTSLSKWHHHHRDWSQKPFKIVSNPTCFPSYKGFRSPHLFPGAWGSQIQRRNFSQSTSTQKTSLLTTQARLENTILIDTLLELEEKIQESWSQHALRSHSISKAWQSCLLESFSARHISCSQHHEPVHNSTPTSSFFLSKGSFNISLAQKDVESSFLLIPI